MSSIVQTAQIHATAVIDESAQIGANVVIGPFAVIGPNVVIGDGTQVGPHAVIERDTQIGRECRIHPGAVLGGDPQDLKYDGERALLVVGDRTVVRECVTMNRGTAARGRTVVGSDCLVMAYAHVAHDCVIGDHVVIANAVSMGGHCDIGDWAIVGGITALHQFVRVGAHAFVGGCSAVLKDVPPFVKAAGDPLKLFGLNAVGLQRRGFSEDERMQLRRAYRILFRSKQNLSDAMAVARGELDGGGHIDALLSFIEGSERGVTF